MDEVGRGLHQVGLSAQERGGSVLFAPIFLNTPFVGPDVRPIPKMDGDGRLGAMDLFMKVG